MNTLDFDLLVNASSESNSAVLKASQTYLTLLSHLASHWAGMVRQWLNEDELFAAQESLLTGK